MKNIAILNFEDGTLHIIQGKNVETAVDKWCKDNVISKGNIQYMEIKNVIQYSNDYLKESIKTNKLKQFDIIMSKKFLLNKKWKQ